MYVYMHIITCVYNSIYKRHIIIYISVNSERQTTKYKEHLSQDGRINIHFLFFFYFLQSTGINFIIEIYFRNVFMT